MTIGKQEIRLLGRSFAITAALTVLGPSRPAKACEEVLLCVEWPVEFNDGPTGDHLTGASTPARGNRVTVIRPVPEPPLGLFLDSDGCARFDTQYAAGHRVVLHNEAIVSEYTHVRAFVSLDELDAGVEVVWPVIVPVIGDDDMISVPGQIDMDRLSNLMGATVETLHQLDSLPGGGLPPTVRRLFPFQDTVPNASAFTDRIRIGSDSLQDKFVIAHEIGHWIALASGVWSSNFDFQPNDDDCRFESLAGGGDVGGHALRSAEFSSGAMTEGFAHFVAVTAFNDPADGTGMFQYYKELSPTAFNNSSEDLVVDDLYQVSVPGDSSGGVNRWAEQMCEDDFDIDSPNEVSSEIDWMRFFWDFITASGTKPSFWDVVALYKFANTTPTYRWSGTGPLFPKLVDAIEDPASGLDQYTTRFENLEASHGLFND